MFYLKFINSKKEFCFYFQFNIILNILMQSIFEKKMYCGKVSIDLYYF